MSDASLPMPERAALIMPICFTVTRPPAPQQPDIDQTAQYSAMHARNPRPDTDIRVHVRDVRVIHRCPHAYSADAMF